MKTNRLSLILGVGVALGAATIVIYSSLGAKETLPPGRFRLTTTTLCNRQDERILLLTIETHEPQWQQVWSPGQTWGGYTASQSSVEGFALETLSKDDEACVGQLWIIVSRFSRGGKDQTKVIIGSGSTIKETTPGLPLERIFDLRIKDGVYPIGEPLIIGKIDGDDIKLGVGPHSKVESLRVEDRALRGDPER